LQEIAGGIRAVHLEAQIGAAVRRHQADIVEHGGRVEQLGVERQAALLPGNGAKEEHAARMVEEQLGLGVANELGDSVGQSAIGDGDAADGGDCVMGLGQCLSPCVAGTPRRSRKGAVPTLFAAD
jgi:hypothetical protein